MVMRSGHRISAFARTAWRDRSDFDWVLHKNSSVGYLGWLNRGNLGDEAMFLGHQEVSPVDLKRIPLQSFGLRLARGSSVDTLLLGGGTLLGRREWSQRLERAIQVFQPEKVLTLGVGVEDPQFALKRNLISEEELADQIDILKTFKRIGVRGPLSQRYLADLGIQSEVMGDSAFVLQRDRSHVPSEVRKSRVLLSLAEVKDGYELNGDRMRKEIFLAAKRVADHMGADLVGLPMEREDIGALRRANSSIDILNLQDDAREVVKEIAEADLVISERLHPNIIAAAVKTPFVAIGYKPKTFDFAESIDATGRVVDARGLTQSEIFNCAEVVLSADASSMNDRLATLVTRFKTAMAQELG